GPMPGTWATAATSFPPGASLVAFTDGLLEARDIHGEDFGEARLAALLERHGPTTAGSAEACVDGVRRFSDGPVADDVTVAILAHVPRPGVTQPPGTAALHSSRPGAEPLRAARRDSSV